ncbi:MAG TPA: TetR family transcriptional regulator [Devosiaceae bacterium]|jgi:TetR/AcrR family transcriptional repressor of nem operon
MARASKAQAAEHHQEIIAAAARLFREQGLSGTTVPEVMQAANLTHGGFYGHFASKNALAAAACTDAFAQVRELIDMATAHHPKAPAAAFEALAATYLSADHRDHPGTGCAAAALVGDIAREPEDSLVRSAYSDSIERIIERLAQPDIGTQDRATAIAAYSTLIGTLLLSRATAGTPLSEEILAAGRSHLPR